MSIVLIEGFDMYSGTGANTGLLAKWSNIGFGGSGSLSLAAGRFGGQALGAVGGLSTSGRAARRTLVSALTSFSIGFAFKVTSLAENAHIFWMINGALSAYQVGLYLDTAGQLTAGRYTSHNASTALGAASSPCISGNVWHYIEVEIVISDTVGVFNVYVDGNPVLTLTGLDTNNSGGNVGAVQLGYYNGGGTSDTWYFDDVYVTNAATKLGERRVETLRGNADTGTINWTRLSGSNNYEMIDETLVDGDTTYNSATTAGLRDLYSIASLGSTPVTVDAANIVSFSRKTDVATVGLYNSIQSGGVDSDGPITYLGSGYGRVDRIVELDPNGSIPWTGTSINALKLGPLSG